MALKVAPAAAELNIKMTNILKIEKLLNDSSYRELIEFSSNFNARLCLERKLRMPFLDPQTQIAQKHSNLYHKKSQRLPGLKEGQIYTYPSPRWRCRKNTNKFSSRPFYRFRATDNCTTMVASSLNNGPPLPSSLSSTMTSVEAEVNGDSLIDAESNSLGAADTDSKDSQNLRDESLMSKDWFYDDMDANDVASEEQPDSDFEFNLNGYKRKRKPVTTRKSSRKPKEQGETSSKKSRPSSSSSASRSNRNSSRKPASKSKAASGKSVDTTNRNFADVDPPSFADVDPHFRAGDIHDGAYF